MTWFELIRESENILKDEYKETYKSELNSILKYCFGMSKIDLIFKKNEEVDEKIRKKVFDIIKLRKEHIPLQYILGYWYFMDLKFKVGKGVLIPREDTEVLVNASLEYLKDAENPKIIDLCSGSGCVAVSVKKAIGENCKVYAAELSERAFSYLKENIVLNNCAVITVNDDIFKIFNNFEDNFFDAVISNPPYIKAGDLRCLQKEVQNEPFLALDGGEDGLYFYKNICKMWIPKIKNGGIIAFEVGANQALDVKKIMESYGIKSIKIFKDINNIERVVIGKK